MTRLRIARLAAVVLAACAGGASAQPIPQAGCVNASPCVQTNVFTPIGATTLSAGTSTSNVALPSVASNLSVVVTNNSASIIAYVNAGTSNSVTATTSNTPIQPGQTVVLLAGANTYLAGITASSTASLTIQVGTGVPVITNAAASSGGVSGGSVTQGTTPWLDNITQWASGVLAAMANYGTAPTGLVPGVNAFVTNVPAVTLNAGSAIAGKVGIDQTTPGTTNKVAVAGNTGAAFDGATGAAAPANALNVGHLTNGATGGFLQTPTLCQQHAFLHITTATDTLAVQGVASQTIHVCGAVSNAAGVATWFLENTASVNANCSSTKVQIAGLQTEAASTRSGFYNPVWGGLANTSGNGLCVNSTGTGGFDIDIFYAQF